MVTSERDHDLVARIRAGTSVGVLHADDPAAVATALSHDRGTVLVAAAALPRAVAGARVRLAEWVLDRAQRAEAPEPEGSAAVRAAQAHLRRQEAAWKVAWWERDEPAPAVDAWSLQVPAHPPITLVTVDADGHLDPEAHATMTAAAPTAVRVVVLQARG